LKNPQPFWKNCRKSSGGIFFDSHCSTADDAADDVLGYVCVCVDVVQKPHSDSDHAEDKQVNRQQQQRVQEQRQRVVNDSRPTAAAAADVKHPPPASHAADAAAGGGAREKIVESNVNKAVQKKDFVQEAARNVVPAAAVHNKPDAVDDVDAGGGEKQIDLAEHEMNQDQVEFEMKQDEPLLPQAMSTPAQSVLQRDVKQRDSVLL